MDENKIAGVRRNQYSDKIREVSDVLKIVLMQKSSQFSTK